MRRMDEDRFLQRPQKGAGGPAPRIVSAASAMPPHQYRQEAVKEFARRHFADSLTDSDRLLGVFDTSIIKNRHLCMALEWYRSERSFEEKNAAYIDWSCRLGGEAARRCLADAGISAGAVDGLIFVSTTGLATPSIDARLIGLLGMSPHTRRTPLWGLGCAGGAAGLGHALQQVHADPRGLVLVVAVELCSLTFNFSDMSNSNLVATALFADGASAVLVAGAEAGLGGPEILDSRSTIWPDSLDVAGWNFHDDGMQVVFSRAIPGIVRKHARADIEGLLAPHDLKLRDLDHLIIHPGGTRIIEAYEQALGLASGRMELAREVLRDCGNVSSVSVLLMLERFLRRSIGSPSTAGLLSALGPGFSSESLLLRF